MPAPARDLDAAARRAGARGRGGAAVGADVAARRRWLRRRHRAPRRARRGAAPARIRRRRGRRRRLAVGRRRLARSRRGRGPSKVQGRRTTVDARPPLPLADVPAGGVRLATSWVEPAYLEPDASWCAPGGEPATPLANGGAFGGKESLDRAGRRHASSPNDSGAPVRVVFSREDVVRLGPEAATDRRDRGARRHDGADARSGAWPVRVRHLRSTVRPSRRPTRSCSTTRWEPVAVPGPADVGRRCAPPAWPSWPCCVEGALAAAGARPGRARVRDEPRARRSCSTRAPRCRRVARSPGRGSRSTRPGAVERVDGAGRGRRPARRGRAALLRDRRRAHGARLGAVARSSPSIPTTGDVHDLTIRSFGVIRPKDTPPIEVEIVDDDGPPLGRGVGRGVRRGRGGDVERDQRRARDPARGVPGALSLRRRSSR